MGANTSKFSSLILTFFSTEKALCLLITYKYQITKITHCTTQSIKGPNGVLRTTSSLGLEEPVVNSWSECKRLLPPSAVLDDFAPKPRGNTLRNYLLDITNCPMLVSSRKWHFKVRVQLGKKISGPDFKLPVLQAKQRLKLKFHYFDKMHDLCLEKNASWRKQKLQERFYFSLRAICYLHTKLILLLSSNFLWVLFRFFLFVCLLCSVISHKVGGYSQNLASRCLDWAGNERRHQPFSNSWGKRTHPFWLICPLPSSRETQSCTETFIWWVKSEPASQLK